MGDCVIESNLPAILAGPLIHEALLLRRCGLRKDQALAAAAFYTRLPPEYRPDLSFYFDRHFYLEAHPDIAGSGTDPLVHFVEHGAAEGRMPHPLIDLRFIEARQPGLMAGEDPVRQLCDALDQDRVQPSAYFDPAHYAAQLARRGLEAGTAGGGLFRHFLAEGLAAGLRPNAFLDPIGYVRAHADVPLDPLRGLAHFIRQGDAEGRRASDAFDGRAYLERYPDVQAAKVPALLHFLTLGRQEGRIAAGRP